MGRINLFVNYAWNSKHVIVRGMAKKVRYFTILDAGCGNGKLLKEILQMNQKGFGIGVDLKKYPSWKKSNIDFIKADVRYLPFNKNTFDLIVSTEVIEHFLEGELFLGEVKRVLRAKGHLIISTPNRLRWSSIVGRPFRRIAGKPPSPEHVREYTPMEFKAMLKTHFKIIEFRYGALNPYLRLMDKIGDYTFMFTVYLILDKLTSKIFPSLFKWDQIVLTTKEPRTIESKRL